jgi:hypothetical protein
MAHLQPELLFSWPEPLADPNGYELRPEQLAGYAPEIVKQGVDLIV